MKIKKYPFCGLDFGTSNTTIGVSLHNNCQLVPLENTKPSIRSAIYYDAELQQFIFGQQGVEAYLNGDHGRLMMSLKSILGSSLMQDETAVGGKLVSYTDILGEFIAHIKRKAEAFIDHEITHVVLGRPIRFHDQDDSKDQLAQKTLEALVSKVGFKEIIFQYEPIAAAAAYEQSVTSEQLAFIVDMGGGTSDFTVIRLNPTMKQERLQDVLSYGGIHIGGTDFDNRLSLKSVMPLLGMNSLMKGSSSDIEIPTSYYHDLTTWHTLNYLYTNKTISHLQQIFTAAYNKPFISRLIHVLQQRKGHYILNEVELAKQRLSNQPETVIDLSFIDEKLEAMATQKEFEETINEHLDKILTTINDTIDAAAIRHSDINAIFYTGGSSKIPIIREKINKLFPQAAIIQGDAFGSVGLGLTLEAQQKFAGIEL